MYLTQNTPTPINSNSTSTTSEIPLEKNLKKLRNIKRALFYIDYQYAFCISIVTLISVCFVINCAHAIYSWCVENTEEKLKVRIEKLQAMEAENDRLRTEFRGRPVIKKKF